jgi:hypothetical protein
MITDFFKKLDALKAALASPAPVEAKLAEVRPLLLDDDVQREFWALLADERWIEPLTRAGMLDNPPAPEQTAEGGTRFRSWGASKYLARVAARAPAQVAAALANLNTSNVSVVGDLVDAAGSMPVSHAVLLVPAIQRAATSGVLWVHLKDASDLCVRLATEGKNELALSLAQSLFAPTSGDGSKRPTQHDSYWYLEGLKRIAPALGAAAPDAFLPTICDWLEQLVYLTKGVDIDSDDDYSYFWRPAIEDHDQNDEHDVVDGVVGCVRVAFESAITHGQMALPAALALLDQRRLLIFRRLALYLLGEYGHEDRERVRQAILDRDAFDDQRLKHEYARLVSRHLAQLSAPDRDRWYGWVDEGPDMSDFEDNVRQNLGRDATRTDRQSRIDYWTFEKLHWIRDILDDERGTFYRRMLAEHGAPELADLNFRVSVRWGEQSPATVAQLLAKPFHEVIGWISSWTAPSGRDVSTPSIGGLVSTFSEYLAQRPEDFSRHASLLIGRPEQFVSAYIRQMTSAIKAGQEVHLSHLLELCSWIVDRPEVEEWQPSRDEVSELVQVACQATRDERPRFALAKHRNELWHLVRALYRDRSTSYILRDVTSHDFRVHDYLDLGMNSPRGKAIEAGLDFARWVALHLAASGETRVDAPGGIQAIPELLELLEWQMAPDNQSLEAMAIIGSRIGVVNWIDREWLAKNAHRLFALERIEREPRAAFGWAAWNAFLCWVRPHIVFYNSFSRQFHYATSQASSVEIDIKDPHQPMFRLGEHLMVLYGRGQLALDSGPMSNLLTIAHPAVRRHAIGFAGSLLRRGDAPEEVAGRFMALWHLYWSGKGKADADAQPRAVMFGTWFASGRFPDEWALSALLSLTDVVPMPEPSLEVVERLAQIAEVDAFASVRVLDRMVRGDLEGWNILAWREPIELILRVAMNSTEPAQRVAEDLIDHLGRRGQTHLGALLSP